jgi:hypothetical protein
MKPGPLPFSGASTNSQAGNARKRTDQPPVYIECALGSAGVGAVLQHGLSSGGRSDLRRSGSNYRRQAVERQTRGTQQRSGSRSQAVPSRRIGRNKHRLHFSHHDHLQDAPPVRVDTGARVSEQRKLEATNSKSLVDFAARSTLRTLALATATCTVAPCLAIPARDHERIALRRAPQSELHFGLLIHEPVS